MKTLAVVIFRLRWLGPLGLALAACAGDSGQDASSSVVTLYGVAWSGVIRAETSDTLMVTACSNEACRTQVVPVAGLAPESSWDQYRPEPAPAGAPTPSPWAAPKAGQCAKFVEWDGNMAISSCAAIASTDTSEIELQAFLNLTLMEDALKTGDEAFLQVIDAETEASLVERSTTIENAAPYYVSIDLDE